MFVEKIKVNKYKIKRFYRPFWAAALRVKIIKVTYLYVFLVSTVESRRRALLTPDNVLLPFVPVHIDA